MHIRPTVISSARAPTSAVAPHKAAGSGEQMAESPDAEARVLMTQVIGSSGGGQILGEIESAGVLVGWNRATLSQATRAALHAILERNGGATDRLFALRHGSLVLLRCRMLPGRPPSQISFDGSQRRRDG